MLTTLWVKSLTRRPGLLAATVGGVALSVALLASIGGFLSTSKATMTERSISRVAVDWQIESQHGSDPRLILEALADDPAIVAHETVTIADTSGLAATSGGTSQVTGRGVVLGLADSYGATFPGTLRDLVGAKSGVLLAQQTAANLRASVGDTVEIGRAGLSAVPVRVDGIVDLPQADSLFQTVGAPVGAQPQAPPDNVVLLSASTWHQIFDPLAATRPDLIHTQVHVRLDHHVPTDPSAAYVSITGHARNVEVRLAGAGLVGDNLGATLGSARSDALYAQVLFLFLGLPGAVLAGLLTSVIASSASSRRRREQALMRTRGATVATLVRLASIEASLVAVLGGVIGVGVASLTSRVAFHSWSLGATPRASIVWAGGAVAIGALISALVIARPARRDARELTVVSSRRTIGVASPTRWRRYGLDLILIGGAGLVFWITGQNGYALVLAPEGVSTISVSYWAFAGPAMLWSGLGLLTWRIVESSLRRCGPWLSRLIRARTGPIGDAIASSIQQQRRTMARAATLGALAVAFAVSTAIFNSTYRHQAEVDAVLSNGADVTVTESPGSTARPADATAIAQIHGVRHVEPIQHRFAYVGADLQDLYGVVPGSIVAAGRLQDAYVQGGPVRQLVGLLSERPDGVLVSAETVKDFQLRPGDLVNLRLQDGRTKAFTTIPFHYIGVAKEFPTAPHDSFLIANASYVARMTGSDAVGAFLVDTGGKNITEVAGSARRLLGAHAAVDDLASSRQIVGSSLTAVDLSGLTRIELSDALALAAAATALTLWLGLAERRRSFAILRALGATPRQLRGFVWAEMVLVVTSALSFGALTGYALSELLVRVLTGVFDPPPAGLSIPVAYLAATAFVIIAATSIASQLTVRDARRAPIASIRAL